MSHRFWVCDNKTCPLHKKWFEAIKRRKPRHGQDSTECPQCNEAMGVVSFAPFFTI